LRSSVHEVVSEALARLQRSRLGGGSTPVEPQKEGELADNAPSGETPLTAESQETVTCLRSVLMKPEHREWVGRILAILDAAYRDTIEG